MKKAKQKKPFNHVLEVQKGRIDINSIFKRIDEGLKRKLEERNGTISSQ